MNCEDFRDDIESYVLGAADEAESRVIEEHLSRCSACRQIERQYVLLLRNVRSGKGGAASDSALVRKIRSGAEPSLRRARMRRRLVRLSSAAASIAAGLLVAGVLWQVRYGGSNGGLGESAREVVVPATPTKTVWQRANAVGMGFTNADDIVVDKGTVFFLAGEGGTPVVSAVDADSGDTRWTSDLISCGYLETDGERIYCVAPAGQGRSELAALDIESGRVEWTFATPETPNRLYQPSKATVVAGGRICWVCENVVYALDADSGEEIWRRAFEGKGCLSRAAAVGDCIYAAGRNGIYCMEAGSGRISWHLPYRFYTWAGARPLLAARGSDALFVAAGSKDGRSLVRHIETSTRRCVWERVVPRVSHIYADSAHLYLRCQDVVALDRGTGDAVWEVKAAGCSPITEYDNMICFVDRTREGRLVAVGRRTGQAAWEVSGLHSCNAFVRVGGRGYLMTDDSIVSAFAFDSSGD